ncbi:MAG: hypothetical protein NTY47_07375 [Candidatus Omnitrophica bacterium]|nr:hypothetical protein [Candidatus Omnitrophota bacterium]
MIKYRFRNKGKHFAIIGVLIIGTLLSIWLFLISQSWEIKRHKEEFNRLASDRAQLFIERVNDHVETVYSIASFFVYCVSVESDEF